MKKIERAIVSVFDKKDVLDFVKVLVNDFGVEILSTGGTGRLLEQNGISFTQISDYTKVVRGTWKTIFDEWLPTSEYEFDEARYDFEHYDERDHTYEGKDWVQMDIYIPVNKC